MYLCVGIIGHYFTIHNFLAGNVSDGEFTSNRTMGDRSAVHLAQLIMNGKTLARHMSEDLLRKKIIPIGCE
jgi:hypothetical protein